MEKHIFRKQKPLIIPNVDEPQQSTEILRRKAEQALVFLIRVVGHLISGSILTFSVFYCTSSCLNFSYDKCSFDSLHWISLQVISSATQHHFPLFISFPPTVNKPNQFLAVSSVRICPSNLCGWSFLPILVSLSLFKTAVKGLVNNSPPSQYFNHLCCNCLNSIKFVLLAQN